MPFIRAFSIDYRSLRLFRVCLGSGLILHALHLIPTVRDFLADGGLAALPVTGLSLLHISTHYWFLLFLLFVLAACGVGLIRNFLPRLSAGLAYLIVYSFYFRTPIIFYGADQVLNAMLFWSVLLPPGKPANSSANTFTNFVSAAALLQLAVIYVFTGFLKSTDVWLWQGMAVFYALQGDTYTTAFGHVLSAVPLIILKIASVSVLILERFGPLLFFSPWFFGPLRMVLFFSFALMHIIFCMSLSLGLFGLFDIIFLTLLLPEDFWNEVRRFRVLKEFRMNSVKDRAAILSPITGSVATVVIIAIFFWNLHTIPGWESVFPKELKRIVRRTVINQNWAMFAPSASPTAGWHVAEGLTEKGQSVTLFSMKPEAPSPVKPLTFAYTLPNARWVAYLQHSFSYDPEFSRQKQFAKYFCEKWNGRSDDPLRSVALWFFSELEVYSRNGFVSRKQLFTEKCEAL